MRPYWAIVLYTTKKKNRKANYGFYSMLLNAESQEYAIQLAVSRCKDDLSSDNYKLELKMCDAKEISADTLQKLLPHARTNNVIFAN